MTTQKVVSRDKFFIAVTTPVLTRGNLLLFRYLLAVTSVMTIHDSLHDMTTPSLEGVSVTVSQEERENRKRE